MINHNVLIKFAYELQEHQKRVSEKLQNQDALLVYHGLGSGKTLTALAAGKAFNKPLTVVGPASLKFNFAKEKAKHKINEPVTAYSYNKPPESAKGRMLVFDEAHRMGRMDSQRSHLPDQLKGDKTLFLTGTPLRNRPSELIPIMRGLNMKAPRDEKLFNQRYITTKKINPNIFARVFRGIKPGEVQVAKNINEIKEGFKGKVDYYKPPTKDYPKVEEKEIDVEMSPKQEAAYKMALKGHPSFAYKIGHGIAPSKSESKEMNAFLTATRQISNYPGEYNLSADIKDAPKITRAYSEIANKLKSDKNYKGVTYSNYLGHGIKPLGSLLEKNKVPYAEFTGKTPIGQRHQIIKNYNTGKIKQLLISGAGGEGLDLRGTKLMQVMEPHWNNPQLEQVKGRVVRYKSHTDLPEEERKVEVQNFVAQPRKHGFIFKHRDKGTDEYLQMLSNQKSALNNQFLKALQEVGSK
jgi:SNF2 family DNA or RNA helicase